MRKVVIILMAVSLVLASCAGPESGSAKDPVEDHNDMMGQIVEKVSFQDVTITDNFWRPKIEVNRESSIRHALQQAEESIECFDIAAGISDKEHKGNMASDSDVYKILQGAAYALHHAPDKELEVSIDSVIDRIAAAQQADGYLFTYWIAHDLSKRWVDLERQHELYCAGHMFECHQMKD